MMSSAVAAPGDRPARNTSCGREKEGALRRSAGVACVAGGRPPNAPVALIASLCRWPHRVFNEVAPYIRHASEVWRVEPFPLGVTRFQGVQASKGTFKSAPGDDRVSLIQLITTLAAFPESRSLLAATTCILRECLQLLQSGRYADHAPLGVRPHEGAVIRKH